MHYSFPIIEHITDVEKAFDSNYFLKVEKHDCIIFNYLFMAPEVFPEISDADSKIRREFRGLTFDKNTGKILRRPFHKFFNYGERQETSNIDISKSHVIYDKIDGSMICPILLNDVIIWGTKLGETEFSHDVKDFVKLSPIPYEEFVRSLYKDGYNPIFEWTAPENRVVIDYGKRALTLLAIRHITTGEYIDFNDYADRYSIPKCSYVYNEKFTDDFISLARKAEGIEGFVVHFDDGHMIKIKSDHYCQLHRVKSYISNEHDIVSLILNNKLDDLKPLLYSEDLQRLEFYESCLLKEFNDYVDIINYVISSIRVGKVSRKEFALEYTDDPVIKSIVFSLWESELDDNLVKDSLTSYILKYTNKKSRFIEFRNSCRMFKNIDEWQSTHRIEEND